MESETKEQRWIKKIIETQENRTVLQKRKKGRQRGIKEKTGKQINIYIERGRQEDGKE